MTTRHKCPKCDSFEIVKNGFHLEKQRHKCKKCRFQFTRETPRGRSAQEKSMAVLLYTMGLSLSTIARIFKVTAPAVLRWVRAFAEKNYEKPEPGEAVVVGLDEMWHDLNLKKTNCESGKLVVIIPVDSLTENVVVMTKPRS